MCEELYMCVCFLERKKDIEREAYTVLKICDNNKISIKIHIYFVNLIGANIKHCFCST